MGTPAQESLFGAPPKEAAETPSAAGSEGGPDERAPPDAPLAERMRPRGLAEFVGQAHLVGPGKWLAKALARGRIPSLLLWGPPGVGKTTLARIVATHVDAAFVAFSAVLGSVAELRAIVAIARERLRLEKRATIVFVDEIHRFNKGQQDAFLPHVEAGTLVLVGATTENPSFAVNAALLSRTKVIRLEPLTEAELGSLLGRALSDQERGLGAAGVKADEEALLLLARMGRGDARRALGLLEAAAEFAGAGRPKAREGLPKARDGGGPRLTRELVAASIGEDPLLYDKAGEEHYNVTSAFIKAMRGSDPDAAVYWMIRMLEAGDDPLFLLRRMIIFASEDIGLADPRALVVATAADDAFRRLGMPEGMYPLVHAALYLATAPKSNAVKLACHAARALVSEAGALPVPLKLRNAVTELMKEEGYGGGYRYPHDEPNGIAAGETYMPDALVGRPIYQPTERGEEAKVGAMLRRARSRGA